MCLLRTYDRVQNANSLSAGQQKLILNLAHQVNFPGYQLPHENGMHCKCGNQRESQIEENVAK